MTLSSTFVWCEENVQVFVECATKLSRRGGSEVATLSQLTAVVTTEMIRFQRLLIYFANNCENYHPARIKVNVCV